MTIRGEQFNHGLSRNHKAGTEATRRPHGIRVTSLWKPFWGQCILCSIRVWYGKKGSHPQLFGNEARASYYRLLVKSGLGNSVRIDYVFNTHYYL